MWPLFPSCWYRLGYSPSWWGLSFTVRPEIPGHEIESRVFWEVALMLHVWHHKKKTPCSLWIPHLLCKTNDKKEEYYQQWNCLLLTRYCTRERVCPHHRGSVLSAATASSSQDVGWSMKLLKKYIYVLVLAQMFDHGQIIYLSTKINAWNNIPSFSPMLCWYILNFYIFIYIFYIILLHTFSIGILVTGSLGLWFLLGPWDLWLKWKIIDYVTQIITKSDYTV